ncbi:MAG TPA: hypothetical protein VGD60_00875 [Candidatus Acidoferrales bacterium]
MATHAAGWKRAAASSAAAGAEALREIQRTVRFPIEVCGLDSAARFFTERSEALATSDVGCTFRLKTEVAAEAILALRLIWEGPRSGAAPAPILFRALRRERAPGGWMIAAAKLAHEETINEGLGF